MSDSISNRFTAALTRHAPDYGVEFTSEQLQRLAAFYEHLLKWNDKLHLVAPCEPEEFAARHVLESLCALPHIPEKANVADIGSGGGLPIVPLLIMRPDIHATLIESSAKKYVYLHETAVNILPDSFTRIITFRFEHAVTPPMHVITCRALDRFPEKLPLLYKWANAGCAFLLFAGDDVREAIEKLGLEYEQKLLPDSERRYLFIVRK
jgi:16S rRNA (guanine527-N7)-methyltransferase